MSDIDGTTALFIVVMVAITAFGVYRTHKKGGDKSPGDDGHHDSSSDGDGGD